MATGRYAPSPTGRLHLGNLRTALLAWLASRQAGGRFLLRFEDLDHQAVRAEHYDSQRRDLEAIGLDWDEPVIRQSDRLDRYRAVLDRLVERDAAYPCFCSRREIREAAAAPNNPIAGHRYPGTCRELSSTERAERARTRTPALRLRSAGPAPTFDDLVAGPVGGELDDFVIRRNDGTPAYNLVVVVDDDAQGVELVVRGDDLLDSTGRHLHLYRLLDRPPPAFAHVPLVLGPDGTRLAKRHGAVDLDDRAARGQSAAEVLTYLAASLGLSPPGEPVTASELIGRLDFAALDRTPLTLTDDDLAED